MAGYPVVGSGDASHHRIAAYYAVPRDVATIKAAIHDFGPIVLSTPWYRAATLGWAFAACSSRPTPSRSTRRPSGPPSPCLSATPSVT